MERINVNRLHLNFVEKNIFHYYNAIPQDVSEDWLITFLNIYEDLQYLPYMLSSYFFTKLSPYITNLFTIFDPNINDASYFYGLFGVIIIFIGYLYFTLIYQIATGKEKKFPKIVVWIYNLLFRYNLLFVLNFLSKGLRICDYSGYVVGIPECDSAYSSILNIISILTMVLICAYNLMYNFFSLNTNCLSSGKYFGTIYYLNNNKLLVVKFFLALFNNYVSIILEINGIDHELVSYMFIFILAFGFGYIAINHLRYQPFYSSVINNYKFGVYFSYCVFSLLLILVLTTGLSNSPFFTGIAPLIIIMLFGLGYKINNIYYKLCINKVYKRYHEKEELDSMMKTEELNNKSSKLIKKNIYKSSERIINEKYIKKELKVFNNYHECEIACRFLRYNRNIDAFKLMKKIFDEGIIEFNHEAYVYIIAWYYIHNMKKFYKENNLLKKFNAELFECENLLNNIKGIKLNYRKKYLIYKTEECMDLERRENAMKNDSGNSESSLKYEELKLEAIKMHIQGLRVIKNLFTMLKHCSNLKEIMATVPVISQLSNCQISANSKYHNILREYPDSKNIVKVYASFLSDVLNKDELAYKYLNEVGKISDRASVKDSQKIDSPITDEVPTLEEKKASHMSQNSLVSYSHSDYSASGMGKEIRKKINSKNSMTNKFLLPIKKLQKNMLTCVGFYIVIFVLQVILTIDGVNSIKEFGSKISKNINIPWSICQSALNVRLLSYNLILNDYRDYGKHVRLLRESLQYLDDVNKEIVNDEMGDLELDGDLIVPVGHYSFDTFESGGLVDSYNRMISNLKFCINREMLRENETIQDILYDPNFRYFLLNSKGNFSRVFSICKKIISDKILATLNLLNVFVSVLGTSLVIITIIVAYISLSPLEKATNKIIYNSLRMFRYFSKDNLDQIINSYEEKIESLCQTIDIDKDIVEIEPKSDNKKSKQKKVLIGCYVVIFIFIILTVVPVIVTLTDVTNITSLIQESSDRLTLISGINLFTYEVINDDRSVFLQNEPNRILKDFINTLNEKQNGIKFGTYGGPKFDNYPSLDYVLKNNGCFRMENSSNTCESVIYDSSYGFDKEVATLPINELIFTYISNVEFFLKAVEDGKYIILPFVNKENIKIIYDQFINNNFFKLQNNLIDNIVGDIQYINDELIKLLIGLIETFNKTMIVMVIIGICLTLFSFIFILNRVFINKIKEMDSFISFLFLVPPSIVNKNEKYKRFLETTQTDD